MTKLALLDLLKQVITERVAKADPVRAQELSKLKSLVDGQVTPESPLASLGWDSLQMTWLLVAVEERLDIDTSTISLFDLYSIDDLLTELKKLVDLKGA